VGALALSNNPDLALVSSASQVAVAAPGTIHVSANPQLSDCDAQAFVDAQTLLGWSGLAEIFSNAPCPE
jgi:hypothetical protein